MTYVVLVNSVRESYDFLLLLVNLEKVKIAAISIAAKPMVPAVSSVAPNTRLRLVATLLTR